MLKKTGFRLILALFLIIMLAAGALWLLRRGGEPAPSGPAALAGAAGRPPALAAMGEAQRRRVVEEAQRDAQAAALAAGQNAAQAQAAGQAAAAAAQTALDRSAAVSGKR